MHSAVPRVFAGRHGTTIRSPGLFRRMRNITSDRELVRYLTRYLLDHEKPAPRRPKPAQPSPAASPEADEETISLHIVAGKTPLRPGIDYIPLSTGGKDKLHSFGAANGLLLKAGYEPHTMSDDERTSALIETWLAFTWRLGIKALHAIFSPDPRYGHEVTAAGGSMDAVLLTSMAETVQAYESRLYPGDSLGFVAGVHHDRAHIHAHALFLPKTESGRRTCLSVFQEHLVGGKRYFTAAQKLIKEGFSEAIERHIAPYRQLSATEDKRRADRQRHTSFEELVLAQRLIADVPRVGPDLFANLAEQRTKYLNSANYRYLINLAHSQQVLAGQDPKVPKPGLDFFEHHVNELSIVADRHRLLREAMESSVVAAEKQLELFDHPKITLAPLHFPGIGVALPRAQFPLLAAIGPDGDALQRAALAPRPVADRIPAYIETAEAAALCVTRQVIPATNAMVETLPQLNLRAAVSTSQLLVGTGAWMGKIASFLEEWEDTPDRQPLVRSKHAIGKSLNERAARVTAEITERHHGLRPDELVDDVAKLQPEATPLIPDSPANDALLSLADIPRNLVTGGHNGFLGRLPALGELDLNELLHDPLKLLPKLPRPPTPTTESQEEIQPEM